MRQVVNARATVGRPAAIAAAVKDYCQFFELGRRTDTLVPTTAVDLIKKNQKKNLVWHTHQQHPDRYSTECILIAGREVLQPS